MTVIVAGPLPLSWGICTVNEVMPRTTAPLVRGKLRAPPLSMFVIPAAYPLMRHTPSRPTLTSTGEPTHEAP